MHILVQFKGVIFWEWSSQWIDRFSCNVRCIRGDHQHLRIVANRTEFFNDSDRRKSVCTVANFVVVMQLPPFKIWKITGLRKAAAYPLLIYKQ
jgi:hypothetical protein